MPDFCLYGTAVSSSADSGQLLLQSRKFQCSQSLNLKALSSGLINNPQHNMINIPQYTFFTPPLDLGFSTLAKHLEHR